MITCCSDLRIRYKGLEMTSYVYIRHNGMETDSQMDWLNFIENPFFSNIDLLSLA